MSKFVDTLTTAIGWAMEGASFEVVANKLKELDHCHVKVYRENSDIKLPTYAKDGDACMDVYVSRVEKQGGRIIYHTGLHFKLPEDYEMEIRPRSSMTKTMAIMQNAPGTLDEGYTGELLIVHRDLDNSVFVKNYYEVGDRIAQILVRRREKIVWDEVESQEDLGETERGNKGFGSTGK